MATMTDAEKNALKQEIIQQLRAESHSVTDLEEATSLNGLTSLPAVRGAEMVRVPLSLIRDEDEEKKIIRTRRVYRSGYLAQVEGRGECVVYDVTEEGSAQLLEVEYGQFVQISINGVTRNGRDVYDLRSIQDKLVCIRYIKKGSNGELVEHTDAVIDRNGIGLGGNDFVRLGQVYGREWLFFWLLPIGSAGENRGYGIGMGETEKLIADPAVSVVESISMTDASDTYELTGEESDTITITNRTSPAIDYTDVELTEGAGTIIIDELTNSKTILLNVTDDKGIQIYDADQDIVYKYRPSTTVLMVYNESDDSWYVTAVNVPVVDDYSDVVADSVVSADNATDVSANYGNYSLSTGAVELGDIIFVKETIGTIAAGVYGKLTSSIQGAVYVTRMKMLATLNDLAFIRSTDALSESGLWTVTKGNIVKIMSGSLAPVDPVFSASNVTADPLAADFATNDIVLLTLTGATTAYTTLSLTSPSVLAGRAKVKHLLIVNNTGSSVSLASSIFGETVELSAGGKIDANYIFYSSGGVVVYDVSLNIR